MYLIYVPLTLPLLPTTFLSLSYSFLCLLPFMDRTCFRRSHKLPLSSSSSFHMAPFVALTVNPFPSEHGSSGGDSLDFDVIVILAAMLCALVCALGLNSMLQCVIRCTRRIVTEPVEWVQSLRENVGLKKEDVRGLPITTYSTSSSPATPTSGCAICLADFSDGDRVRVMPMCHHPFHVPCIDTWLLAHSSSPTCRQRISSHNSCRPVGPSPEIAVSH